MTEDTRAAVVSRLIESVPALVIVLGSGLVALGAGGGIKHEGWLPIEEPLARIAAAAAGAIMILAGVWQSATNRSRRPHPRAFGISITQPREGEVVSIVDVRGTVRKALPEGYTLRVLIIYSDGTLRPVGTASVNASNGTWEMVGCDAGGKAGERRTIAAYLVGPAGAALVEYFTDAARSHRALMEQFRGLSGKGAAYLPNIKTPTPDMVECARVSVTRALEG